MQRVDPGLGRFRSWGTSSGWYLRSSWGLSFSPVGALEVVTSGTLQVSMSGWALDPDSFFPPTWSRPAIPP